MLTRKHGLRDSNENAKNKPAHKIPQNESTLQQCERSTNSESHHSSSIWMQGICVRGMDQSNERDNNIKHHTYFKST